MRWDDIEILQAIDRIEEQSGGTELWMDGRLLMEDVAGGHVAEDQRDRGFVRELFNLQVGGYLTFRVDSDLTWAQTVRRTSGCSGSRSPSYRLLGSGSRRSR
jgi:hypothetical protein